MAESSDMFHVDVNKNVSQTVSNGNELCFVAKEVNTLSEISNNDFHQTEKRDLNIDINNDSHDINVSSSGIDPCLVPASPLDDNSKRNVIDETLAFSRNESTLNEMACLAETNTHLLRNGSDCSPPETCSPTLDLNNQPSEDSLKLGVSMQSQLPSDNLIKIFAESVETKCESLKDLKIPNSLADHLSSTRLQDISQNLLGETLAQADLLTLLSQIPENCTTTELPIKVNVSNDSELLKSNIDFSSNESIIKGHFPPDPSTNSNDIFPDSSLGNSFMSLCNFTDASRIGLPSDSSEGNSNKAFPSANDNDDEEFTDAVQFFKDPSSFQFLENIQTSVPSEANVPRSSLYMTFDPLLSKSGSQQSKPAGSLLNSEQKTESKVPNETINCALQENKEVLETTARESIRNNLLSFDSPQINTKKESNESENLPISFIIPKLYTEEQLQTELKNHELKLQETYLKQHRLTEEEMKEMGKEKDEKLQKLSQLCKVQQITIEELVNITTSVTANNKEMKGKLGNLEEENSRLKEDIKVAVEDLQSVESTFSDFHKRYEQCKGMLKTYKENEILLKEDIDNWKSKFNEQLHMYNALQERTNETLEKANIEVASAKKSSDAQVAVLTAQLKKAELKISSLESDLKQMRIENTKLGSICDDLMVKVRET